MSSKGSAWKWLRGDTSVPSHSAFYTSIARNKNIIRQIERDLRRFDRMVSDYDSGILVPKGILSRVFLRASDCLVEAVYVPLVSGFFMVLSFIARLIGVVIISALMIYLVVSLFS